MYFNSVFRTSCRLVFAASVVGAASSAIAQQVGQVPVSVEVLSAPTAALALGRRHLVYEVHLTNFGASPLTVEQLDVVSGAVSLESLTGARLGQRTIVPGAAQTTPSTSPRLVPGVRAVVYMWVSLQPGALLPPAVQHRLIIAGNGSRRDTLLTANVTVSSDSLTVLGAPVRGGPWVAIRGPSNTSGHRLSIVAMHGYAGIPQRYAIDWAMLGADGKLFHGDSSVAANWYGYAKPVHAVAAGTVIVARDGAPEHAAFAATPPGIIEANDATGNVIVLDIGGGKFVTYAHLRPGSLKVKQGARVAEGQLLAEIGNSGNTLGPHLHIHVNTSAEPLGGEGLPYVLRSFELIGRINSMGAMLSGTPWMANAAQPARMVQRETPLENMIVRWNNNP